MSGNKLLRQTIELVCTILQENGTSPVSAEIFRLAKFNKDEATKLMWKLLSELICYCNFDVIDEDIQWSEDERCTFVKREMQNRGYLSHDFAHLAHDSLTGSRELLLAMAWLLCKECIVEKFMETCTSPLDDDMSHWCKAWPSLSESGGSYTSVNVDLSPGQRVQRLLMLNGKLRLNLRRMYSVQQQEAKLRNKIENATRGNSLTTNTDSMSVLEIHLLRHPQLLKKMLLLLEKDNERLRNLLCWKDHEDMFWKWMDSVLDLKMKARDMGDNSDEVRSGAVYLNVPVEAQRDLQVARQQLVKAILSYETSIQNIEDLWEVKKHTVTTQDLEGLIASINLDIHVHKTNLMLMRPDVGEQTTIEPVYRLQSRTKVASRVACHVHEISATGEGWGEDSVEAELLSKQLQRQIDFMSSEVSKMHQKCQRTMISLAQRIPSAICIEPTSTCPVRKPTHV